MGWLIFCPRCVKELKGNDHKIVKIKVSTTCGGSSKVKQAVCNECGAHAIG